MKYLVYRQSDYSDEPDFIRVFNNAEDAVNCAKKFGDCDIAAVDDSSTPELLCYYGQCMINNINQPDFQYLYLSGEEKCHSCEITFNRNGLNQINFYIRGILASSLEEAKQIVIRHLKDVIDEAKLDPILTNEKIEGKINV